MPHVTSSDVNHISSLDSQTAAIEACNSEEVMKRKSEGFTLVELLVVIGIIALLISILLPSLNRVRYQAKLTSCAARMHDVLLSVMMYANDNKGALPPFPGDRGASTAATFDIDGFTSAWNGLSQQASASTSTFAANDDGVNLGRLYKTKYLKSPKSFFCPDAKGDVGLTVPARDFRTYLLNPHIKYTQLTPVVLRTFWWKKLAGYGRVSSATLNVIDPAAGYTPNVKAIPTFARALLTEPFLASSDTDVSNITHTVGLKRSFNFGYPDGSVRSYSADKFAARTVDRWVRFLDISNALQCALDGGKVDFRAGNWQNTVFNAVPIQP